MKRFTKRFDIWTSIVYGVIATLWIVFSDSLVFFIFGNDKALNERIAMFKGIGFVVVTMLALFFVLSNELHKRSRIEQELQLERDISPTAIVVIDTQGLISYANVQAEKILGRPRNQIIGQHFADANWHVTDHDGNPLDSDYPKFAQALQSGQSIFGLQPSLEVEGGKRVLLEINLAPIINSLGTSTGAVVTFSDVTAKKNNEKRLRESEHALVEAQTVARLGNLTWDTRTNMVQASDEVYHILGLDRAKSTDQLMDVIETVIHPEDRVRIMEEIGAVLTNKKPGGLEYRVIWPDGSIHYVWTQAGEPVMDAKGNLLQISGIVQDITAHKLAAKALQESEARYRMLIEQASDGIFLADSQGRYIDANSAACALTGYSREEILRMTMYDMVITSPDEPLRFKAMQEGKTVINERQIVRKDGTLVPIEISGKQLPNGDFQGIVRDITERKQNEKALQESEVRYRMLIEQASDAIFIADDDGYCLEANSAACKLLGYTHDEILQLKTPDLFIIPADKPLRREELRQGKTLLIEREMIRKDGSRLTVEVSSKLLGDGTVQAIARDITERKWVEQELRLKSAALEAAANGIVITDVKGLIEWANPAFSTLTGYTLDDAQGHNPRELVRSGEHDPDFYKTMWTTIMSGQVWRGEITNRRKDGSLYTEEMTITPLTNEQGEISHFIAIKQDITVRKQSEIAIQQMNAQLEARVIERTTQLNHIKNRIESILNNNADSIVYSRSDGRIEQVNPAFTKAFGYVSDEILLQPLSMLVIPQDVPKLEQAVEKAVSNRQIQQVDVTASTQDGKTFEAAIMLSPVIENQERLVGLVSSIHDFTSRNQLLHQAMNLSELKSRYVSMAAHDLRNPMAVILTSADTLEHYGDRLTDDKKQAKFSQIRTSIRNMTDILDDVLVMGQVDSGKLDFRPTPMDLTAFCQTLIAESIQATGTSIHINYSTEGIDSFVPMDAKLLRHILGNLLSNAIKYSPVDSSIMFSIQGNAKQITFRVQDCGIGIPVADHARLFETFYRASNAKHVRGTGLGLAIVKQSVEQHGGSITFESEEGHGTTFTVTLPIIAQ